MSTPSTRGHRSRHGAVAATVAVLALGLSACDLDGQRSEGLGGGDSDGRPATLTASRIYTQANPVEAPDRLSGLQGAIDRLRDASASGWIGRQDDETGYLAELTGGRYATDDGSDTAGLVGAFFDDYGPDLFGIGIAELELGEQAATPAGGTTSLRADQQLDGVPVLDAALLLTVTSPDADPRINVVRGRVFPGLDVATTPEVTAERAVRLVRRLSGADVPGPPELVIVPDGTGILAWQATAVGSTQDPTGSTLPADGLYLVDAVSGELITIRPASGHSEIAYAGGATGSAPASRLRSARGVPAAGEAVEVTGSNVLTGPLTAIGSVSADGNIGLRDTTVPSFDPATGSGGIETYDATGIDEAGLPGNAIKSTSPEFTDSDAIAAHAYARFVYDYYAELGRLSWDGAGATLVSSVNFGPEDYCNAFFNSELDPPQMVYGETCTLDGIPQATSGFSIDTAGHEITHGVTSSSSDLIYSGQSGALNESFSDYFGNIIGNLWYGDDSDAYSEHRCVGMTPPTLICTPNPDGTSSARFLLNGNTLDDYARLLEPGFRSQLLQLDNQDNAGVHLNSAVWNNALWSIRKRLAQIDGVPGNESGLARDFDKIVYHVLTQRLVPSSGFLDARAAIEETTAEAGADPVVLRVAREVFDDNLICSGCGDPDSVPGLPLATSSGSEQAPSVSGDLVAWLDAGAGDGFFGAPTGGVVGDTPAGFGGSSDTVSVVLAGASRLIIDAFGVVSLTDEDGTATELGATPGVVAVRAGLAGSDVGGAWVDDTQVHFVDPAGAVVSAPLPTLGDQLVTGLATGDGVVALATSDGRVFRWRPGEAVEPVGNAREAVVSLAAYGERILAVDANNTATFFGADDTAVQLSTRALPFGAAMNAEYAVWSEAVGELPGRVNESQGFPDSDLYLYSFGTGTIYNLMPSSGQQGFPALSGDRVVWQDAVFGGDDILTATVPPGL